MARVSRYGPGSVTFTAAATGTVSTVGETQFALATSNSVLIAPPLTFQVKIDDPAACILRISLPMAVSFNGHAGAVDWIASRFRKQRPATLYYDEVRTPTYGDCLSRVCEIVLAGSLSGIYHAGGPRQLSLYQIAQVINRVGAEYLDRPAEEVLGKTDWEIFAEEAKRSEGVLGVEVFGRARVPRGDDAIGLRVGNDSRVTIDDPFEVFRNTDGSR